MRDRIININETLKVVCGAVAEAEADLAEQVKLYYHGADEEFITFAFYCHIRHRLRKASRNKLIEGAFLKDLKAALRQYQLIVDRESESDVSPQATGLVADMVLHNKPEEGRTGGDFGLVVVHPKIIVTSKSIEAKKGFSSGLLCQAKMKRRGGKWGNFSENQTGKLPERLDYASLVLYSYSDEERSELNPLAWKLCRGSSLPDLELALKGDAFGETLGTPAIVRSLGRGEIGTSDQAKIEEFISPSARQHLELRIYWSKGYDPKGPVEVKVRRRQTVDKKVHVKVYRT